MSVWMNSGPAPDVALTPGPLDSTPPASPTRSVNLTKWSAKDVLGEWSGYWNSTWAVRFTIIPGAGQQLGLQEEWEPYSGPPSLQRRFRARLVGNVLTSGNGEIQITFSDKNPNSATAVGNLLSETQPNTVITTYQYDDLNRLTDETASLPMTYTNGAVVMLALFNEQYGLYDNGLRADEIDTRWDGSEYWTVEYDWTYDNEGRLTSESLSISDPPSSSTTSPVPYIDTFTYDLANNRIQEEEGVTIQPDEGDNTIPPFVPNETIAYTYNSNDQLVKEAARCPTALVTTRRSTVTTRTAICSARSAQVTVR